MALAALYYKIDEIDTAERYLLQMRRFNKATTQFFSILAKGDISEYMTGDISDYSRTPISELIDGYSYYSFLISCVPTFVNWADDMLGSLL